MRPQKIVGLLLGLLMSLSSCDVHRIGNDEQSDRPNLAVDEVRETRIKYKYTDLAAWKGIDIGPTLAGLSDLKIRESPEAAFRINGYFATYGYLEPGNGKDPVVKAATTEAIKRYQNFYKLRVTGALDPATLKKMAEPRCAMPDSVIEAATRCPWGGPQMKYYFEKFSRALPEEDCRAAFVAAFNTWQQHVPIAFVEVKKREDADVVIAWIQQMDGDYVMAQNCSAHSDWPPGCCHVCPSDRKMPIHFNERHCTFVIGQRAEQYDLETVAVHEIGHVLGMKHSDDNRAVMYSNVYPGILKRVLSSDDLAGIKQLYPPK